MAPNRAHNLRITFHDSGVTVTPRTNAANETPWAATMTLETYGRQGLAGKALGETSWSLDQNKAQVQGQGITIDYSNDKEGLRQDFRIQERPPGSGPLRLDFKVERKGLNLNLDTAQSIIHFTKAKDENVMQYRDLKVFDANQRPLTARMVRGDADRFAIVVEDQGAAYPIQVDPTFLSDGLVFDSADSGAQLFGYSVAYIDWEQNVYDDDADPPGGAVDQGGLLVGVPHYDNGSDSDAGEVCFYEPSSGSLPSSPTWTYAGSRTGELLGWSVADGGENNIGSTKFHNILVGAPGYGVSTEGAALAFYPDSDGDYGSSPNWLVIGALGSGSDFGWSVAGNVDFNQDGYGDVIVGAPNGSVIDARFPGLGSAFPDLSLSFSGDGAVAVYEGNGSGYNSNATWEEFGGTSSGFGFSVEWGKVNGTIYPAVLVGAPGVSSSSGAVYEFLNDLGTLDTTPDLTLSGGSGSLFGYALSSRADQNDDGYQDLLVGAPNATYDSKTGAGKVYLYQGSATGLGSTAAWSTGGDGTNAECGASVMLGDMNYDGYADVMAGEPNMSDVDLTLTQNGFVQFYITDTSTGLPTNTEVVIDGLYSHLKTGTSLSYGQYLTSTNVDLIVGSPGSATNSVGLWYWSP